MADLPLDTTPEGLDAHLSLICAAPQSYQVTALETFFNHLLSRYPTSSSRLKCYCEVLLSLGETDKTSTVLKQCLLTLGTPHLYRLYLEMLQKRPETEDVIAQAFELATQTDRAGSDYADGIKLFHMHLEWLKSTGPKDGNQFETGQKLSALRKVYARALAMPLRGVDVLWTEYVEFETQKNATTAKVRLDEMKPAYAHAAQVAKERERFWAEVLPKFDGIEFSPRPEGFEWKDVDRIDFPTKALPRSPGEDDPGKVKAWQNVLAFEKTNPEQLPPVDFKVRVRSAFNKALEDLRFYPEIWYAFYDFERSVSDDEASLIILRESIKALPDSHLLVFALADALEKDGAKEEAKKILDDLLLKSEFNTAVCIHRMRFARRTEGTAEARIVFKRARNFPDCDSAIYCAAAEMEFRANKAPSIARNIFELGLKRFKRDAKLGHRYLDLICSLNDDGSCRDVFERIIESFTTNRAAGEDLLAIWERYREFERDMCRDGGDVNKVQEIEQRMAEHFTKYDVLTGLTGVLHRYVLYGQIPVGAADESFLQNYATQTMSAASDFTKIVRVMDGQKRPAGAVTGKLSTAAVAAAVAAAGESTSTLPRFLQKLDSILPKSSREPEPDPAALVRSLGNLILPPPPAGPSRLAQNLSASDYVAASQAALTGAKRKADQVLGSDGAPMDAFKQRQQAKRAKQ